MRERSNLFADMLALTQAMDNIFEQAFNQPTLLGNSSRMATPPVNVYDTGEAIVVSALLPGVQPEAIQVNVEGQSVTIAGQIGGMTQQPTSNGRQESNGNGQYSWYLREWVPTQFQRSITLPVEVNADAANAEFANGILTLTLPKAEHSRPHRITVHAAPQLSATVS